MVKCAKCAKLVNKKAPGLQCNKCNKWLHALCVSITTDQLNALNSTDSVDWKCNSCAGVSKARRLSCILPEDDGEENTDTELNTITNPMTHKILREIRAEVKEVIRQELQRTLQFYSDKIDEYEKKMQSYNKSVKYLENQCTDLRNNLRNINLKYEALENKFNQIEQTQLSNQLEICGIKELEKENLEEVVQKVAVAIQQNPDDIVKVYRKRRRNSDPKRKIQSPIAVVLREGTRDAWLEASKNTDVCGTSVGREDTNKVYLRECLTSATAFLLWKTKTELKELYKYIWCRNGNILIRKVDNAKIMTVRSLQDIENARSFQNRE